ncbi:ABC transporter substrate-binding protein [Elioraea tepidiphila]|jgi:peptide/nickel transport system substrate-binding protein|uniref:ABC transporter substrate-binding protein n=1 Tax=Elioraea tepidiphila TaxID=457934 RepID=UPI00036CDB24|nr:ABC transporter substrate-binding protein [Elioraea tepidiphila]
MTTRRTLLTAGAALAAAAALPRPALAQGAGRNVLRVVPHANLSVIDPIWTTAYITRNAGFMVWDTLFGLDSQFRPQPQMAEGHTLSDDRRVYTITLRPGLRFHDGAPVRSADCVASIRRWAVRDAIGQKLATLVEEYRVLDDRRFEIRLKQPFALTLFALGKPASNVCFIMPERVAATDANSQIRPEDVIGSGPFRFQRDEWNPGARAVWTRNPDYQPRSEPADWVAGGKRANFERIEWHIIPDAATAAAALQSGEVDWWETPLADLFPVLRRDRNIVLEQMNPLGEIGILRFNHLHPPFDNAAIRRALAMAMDQADYMQAIVGNDPALWKHAGFFTPGTPMATEKGLEALTGPRDIEAAKRALAQAGYNGEKVVLIAATDIPITNAQSQVTAELLRRLGMNLEYVATDWGTVVQRRASREPVERGGWSLFHTWWAGFDHANPAAHLSIRGNGTGPGSWFGWPTSPRLEELRDAWFVAPTEAEQARICEEMQMVALRDLPYVPTGQFFIPFAFRRDITGILKGPMPLFWNVSRR